MSHERACRKRNTSPSEPAMPPVPPPQMSQDEDCPHCSLLPAGSVNVTGMFIVVTCCLTAVLFTAIYKIDMQQAEINNLNSQINAYETINAEME